MPILLARFDAARHALVLGMWRAVDAGDELHYRYRGGDRGCAAEWLNVYGFVPVGTPACDANDGMPRMRTMPMRARRVGVGARGGVAEV